MLVVVVDFLIAEVEGATTAEGTVDGLHAVDAAMGVERSGISIRVALSVVILTFFEPRTTLSASPERVGEQPGTDFDTACLVSRRGTSLDPSPLTPKAQT